MTGTPRIRGHRHVGGPLGQGERERHYAALIALTISTIAAGISAYSQVQAAETQADIQKKTAEFNQQVANNQAKAAREAAGVAEENQRTQDRRIIAAQRARAAASGISEDEGSALLATEESASISELNSRRIRWAGANQQAGYQAEAGLQAFMGRQAGAIRRAGYLQAGTTLLTGLSRGASAYSSGGSSGGGGGYSPGNANMLN